jgi:7-carboxy-7-deazaguanine synthase
MTKFWVSEKFVSIQGEGPLSGRSATFIRTAYCNLHCTWCDAWYTWDHSRVNVKETSKQEETTEVAKWIRNQVPNLVIFTGGEPLLQEDALFEVFLGRRSGQMFQFETNGTIKPHTALSMCQDVWWVVSPKLKNNGADNFKRRIKPRVLEWFNERPHTAFKFVIESPQDIDEVACLELDNVILMPEGTTSEELDEKMPWIIEACIEQGWTYSDRLHIRAFGDKRGT